MTKASKKIPSAKKLPNDPPVKLDMSFEDAMKLALNTPIKKKTKK